MAGDAPDLSEGLMLLPVLAEAVDRLEAAGRRAEASVARRCIELVRSGTPDLAAQVWRANAETVRSALPASG